MTNKMKSLLFSLMLIFLGFNAYAQQGIATSSKIGVISFQELIASMPEASKADTALQAYQKELQETYATMVKEYQAKDSIYAKDSLKFNATQKELKKGELTRSVQQIQQFQQSVDELLQRKQQELLAPIRTLAVEAIQEYAKKNGYAYVAEKGVFFHTPANADILNEVKKELKNGGAKTTVPATPTPPAKRK